MLKAPDMTSCQTDAYIAVIASKTPLLLIKRKEKERFRHNLKASHLQ